jgi:hypothetical protein
MDFFSGGIAWLRIHAFRNTEMVEEIEMVTIHQLPDNLCPPDPSLPPNYLPWHNTSRKKKREESAELSTVAGEQRWSPI